MIKAYIFPGQGAQHVGMGKSLYENNPVAREYFERANEILGYRITDIMFEGTEEELRQTKITQPAVYIHSVISARCADDFKPDMVAGHSLGEISALVAAGVLNFEDGLRLVDKRARAMQTACEMNHSTMAAVIGVPSAIVEMVCAEVNTEESIVVIANYNSPENLVISGHFEAVKTACEKLRTHGAKCLQLRVSGAFHSPLMESARQELTDALEATVFMDPVCPVYQNVDYLPHTNPEVIKENILSQLTSPVLWKQEILNMLRDGADEFIECGPDTTLTKYVQYVKDEVAFYENDQML